MQLSELDEEIVNIIRESDHPEIVSIERVATGERAGHYVRLSVKFASGAAAAILVKWVAGAGAAKHAAFELPREAL